MKLKLSNLLKGFTVLNRLAKEISKTKSSELRLAASPEEVKASRLTPERIRNLRVKKGLSQRELGILTGATIGAVQSWEKGTFKPRGDKKAALVALRKLTKGDVKKMLAEKAERVKPGKAKNNKAKRKRQ